jgi:flagellar protein FlaG
MTNLAPATLTTELASQPLSMPTQPAAPIERRAVEQPTEFRLVIEEDSAGSFVYKTLDRRTGEVVNQFPREQMLRLKEAEGYQPGKVFNSRS